MDEMVSCDWMKTLHCAVDFRFNMLDLIAVDFLLLCSALTR